MSTDKTMVEWLSNSRIGYGADVYEMARRLDALTERVEKTEQDVHRLMSDAIINGKFAPPAPKPEGVYVRPGDRVWNNGRAQYYVVAPSKSSFRVWADVAHGQYLYDSPSIYCYDTQPVLGYVEDRP